MRNEIARLARRLLWWGATAAALPGIGCSVGLPLPDREQHRAEMEAWHAARIEEITQHDGVLSIAGLFWLEPGEHTFGGDSTNAVVFPAIAPSRIGTLVRTDQGVTMRVNEGVPVTYEGHVVDSLDLYSVDPLGFSSAILGSLQWSVFPQADRVGVFVQDSANPMIADFAGIDTFPISLDWVLQARFERYDPPKAIRYSYAVGGASEQPSPGAVLFEVAGEELRLDATEYGDSLFIVFGDRTNGEDTYGGGRFLRIPLPSEGDRLLIDFNRAQNPPCAFTPHTSCPLPPRQNLLTVRIEAGERTYQQAGH